jgi:hypothetical protein
MKEVLQQTTTISSSSSSTTTTTTTTITQIVQNLGVNIKFYTPE